MSNIFESDVMKSIMAGAIVGGSILGSGFWTTHRWNRTYQDNMRALGIRSNITISNQVLESLLVLRNECVQWDPPATVLVDDLKELLEIMILCTETRSRPPRRTSLNHQPIDHLCQGSVYSAFRKFSTTHEHLTHRLSVVSTLLGKQAVARHLDQVYQYGNTVHRRFLSVDGTKLGN